jgi:hypothetical protein
MARMNVITEPPKGDLKAIDVAVIMANIDKKVGPYEKITFSPSGLVLTKEEWDFYVRKYSDLLKPKPTATTPPKKTYEELYWEYVKFSGTGNPVNDFYKSQKMLEAMCEVVTVDTEHVVDKPAKELTFLERHPMTPRNVLWVICFIWLLVHILH